MALSPVATDQPLHRSDIPVFVADYVLIRYGTGAIMAVPAEDERDWDFATPTVSPLSGPPDPPEDSRAGAWTGEGIKENSRIP